MKDKELKFEEGEASVTLGGLGELKLVSREKMITVLTCVVTKK
jgi:hypothetical protein